ADPLGFCAGADVRERLDRDGHLRRMGMFADLYDAVVSCPKPTVAACHGDVVRAGAEIPVACDPRVGGAHAPPRLPPPAPAAPAASPSGASPPPSTGCSPRDRWARTGRSASGSSTRSPPPPPQSGRRSSWPPASPPTTPPPSLA